MKLCVTAVCWATSIGTMYLVGTLTLMRFKMCEIKSMNFPVFLNAASLTAEHEYSWLGCKYVSLFNLVF